MRRFSASVLTLAMSMTRYRLAVMAALSALALLVLPGCSSGGTTSAPTKAPTAPPSSPTSQTYVSKAFVVPLTVTGDTSLKSPPNPDSPHLLSWDTANSSTNKFRFLMPVNLYLPDSSTPEAPPKHYLKYLRGFTKLGAQFSNVTKVTVDGHPATLMSATATPASGGVFDGSLGCPNVGADQ
jgi:hypothetical protein